MSQYGPNSELVERFLARLARLSHADISAAVAAWRDGLRCTNAWYTAEDEVGDALTATRRHDEEWRLQEHLYELFRRATWRLERPVSPSSTESSDAASQYLAGTAAFALMVADALSVQGLTTLYAPFAEVIPLGELGLDLLSQRKLRERATQRSAERDSEWRAGGDREGN